MPEDHKTAQETHWTTKDGRRIAIAEMADEHLKSAHSLMVKHVRGTHPKEHWPRALGLFEALDIERERRAI